MVFIRHLLVVLMAFTSLSAFAQITAPVSVDFTLYAPGLSKNTPVYLSGGTPSLGNWDPKAVRMEYQGGNTWRAVVLFNRSMEVEYRYTLGTDERLAADHLGQPRGNFVITARRNLDVRDEVRSWTDENTVVTVRGQASGDIRYHRHVRDGKLPARDIVVWLPRFYDLQDRRDYPVLYLNDGQDIFDPATAEGGRDWGVDEAMQRLIDEEIIEPMIVVGVFSSDDRLDEYAPDRSGEAYMSYLVNTVKPLIDRRYRTRAGRHNTFVGGAAMGGLIAFATAWAYPEVFGAAISLSPAFQLEGRIDALPWFAERAEDMRSVFFYLDVGGQGADALLRPGVEAMVDQLKAWGYQPERNYVFIRDMDADHGVQAWSQRFPEALSRSVRGARRFESMAARQSLPDPGPDRGPVSDGVPAPGLNAGPVSLAR